MPPARVGHAALASPRPSPPLGVEREQARKAARLLHGKRVRASPDCPAHHSSLPPNCLPPPAAAGKTTRFVPIDAISRLKDAVLSGGRKREASTLIVSDPTTPPHPPLTAYYSDAAARPSFVRRLFDETASDYDRINAVFSFGTGRRYRRRSLLRAGLRPGDRVVDVATGTGMVAAEARRLVGPTGMVAALDVSWGMLQQARAAPGLGLVQGSVDALPFAAGSFDVLTMGYALRHVAALGAACAEFLRVLRPGGQVLLLEVGRPDGRIARNAARLLSGPRGSVSQPCGRFQPPGRAADALLLGNYRVVRAARDHRCGTPRCRLRRSHMPDRVRRAADLHGAAAAVG